MKVKITRSLIICIILLLLGGTGFWFFGFSLRGYTERNLTTTSSLSDALAIFSYNKSQHNDSVPGCWYDSGDYVIFSSRNSLTLFYLSLAYESTQDEKIKIDLLQTINNQLDCLTTMLNQNIKQFRDQDNHGINLPPTWNDFFYPNNTYYFDPNEGRDIYLLLSLTYKNINQPEKANYYSKLAADKKYETESSNCCEQGSLKLSRDNFTALDSLANDSEQVYQPDKIWGIQPTSLATMTSDNTEAIRGLLEYLQNQPEVEKLFYYTGGNYDIAGTIALERLYAQQTGDRTFNQLSDKLWRYLHGENEFNFNFTNSNYIYHPCYFFHACRLSDTLVNGIDEDEKFKQKSWQNSEVQLVGQAQYILAKVLYKNL